MKRNYRMKRTISVKQFITEFADSLSKDMKERIQDLWPRCVLTRDEDRNILDLRHVEHTLYNCESGKGKMKKEYAYGQLIVEEGNLYFSKDCIEDDKVMKAPVVDLVYDLLSDEEMYYGDDVNAKKVDDSNIDEVIDNILQACPPMSQRHLEIISKYRDVDDFNNQKVSL